MIEVFQDIPGFVGYYQASNHGQVKSLRRKGRRFDIILKLARHRQGYRLVFFRKEGFQYGLCVHGLVWLAFNGPVPDGLEIDHINDDPTDNRLSNLQLLTHRENVQKEASRAKLSKSLRARYAKEPKGPRTEVTKKKISVAMLAIWAKKKGLA